MAKNLSEAKLYILQAKYRLTQNGYKEYFLEQEANYCLNNQKLTKSQFKEMYQTIKEIVACDEFVSNTLDRLVVDKSEFNKLGESDKVKYMLELSHIYHSIKKKLNANIKEI